MREFEDIEIDESRFGLTEPVKCPCGMTREDCDREMEAFYKVIDDEYDEWVEIMRELYKDC